MRIEELGALVKGITPSMLKDEIKLSALDKGITLRLMKVVGVN